MFRMQGGPTDVAVVAQVVAGDRELYSLLVQRHTRSIFGLAFRVTGNDADADEVVQDTFLKAYKSLHRFEQRANFGTWLYRIGMNCALDLVEKRKMNTVSIDEEPEDDRPAIQLESD